MDRPVVYRVLLLLAILIVVQHLFAHAGFRPLSLTMGWQDLRVGYPAGVMVGLVLLMLWGKNPNAAPSVSAPTTQPSQPTAQRASLLGRHVSRKCMKLPPRLCSRRGPRASTARCIPRDWRWIG